MDEIQGQLTLVLLNDTTIFRRQYSMGLMTLTTPRCRTQGTFSTSGIPDISILSQKQGADFSISKKVYRQFFNPCKKVET
jgi:hypothetical protein